MDLKLIFSNILASYVIVVQRIVYLMFYPYKTMRTIAKEKDLLQIIPIITLIAVYFIAAGRVKDFEQPGSLLLAMVVLNFCITVAVPMAFSYIHTRTVDVKRTIVLFSYTLIPTIIWFFLNTFLFVAVPPPRHLTIPGKIFSILFITLSVSLLAWKVMLWYLAARFSTKLQFYDLLYIFIVYLAIILPYSILLYHFGFFRIPFI